MRCGGGGIVSIPAAAGGGSAPAVTNATFTTATSPSGTVGTVDYTGGTPTSWAIHDNSDTYPIPSITVDGRTVPLYSGNGNLNGYFSINSSGVVSIASTPPDGIYTFTVTATNTGGSGNGVVSVRVNTSGAGYVAISPATGQPFPCASNCGYQNAPGYTGGSLTSGTSLLGTLSSGTYQGNFSANTTYTGYLFDLGSANTMKVNAANVTFVGCYFGSSDSTTATITCATGPVTFSYCTHGPSPSVVGGSFPPLPPTNDGGYITWPSDVGQGNDEGLNGTKLGYGYGPMTDGAQSWPTGGGAYFYANDMWGSYQGPASLVTGIGATNPGLWDGCWMHDPPYNPPAVGAHCDCFNYEVGGSPTITHVTLNNCVCAGNWNGRPYAMQIGGVFNNFTITNNYFDGGNYIYELGSNEASTAPTNYIFCGNVTGYGMLVDFGMVYQDCTSEFSVSASGNKWRNNTFFGGSDYAGIGNVPAGYFMYPNGSAHATDFTGAY